MIKCKDCKFWTRFEMGNQKLGKSWSRDAENDRKFGWSRFEGKDQRFGECKSRKLRSGDADLEEKCSSGVPIYDDDELVYWDITEEYNAFFATGQNYGCIHGQREYR